MRASGRLGLRGWAVAVAATLILTLAPLGITPTVAAQDSGVTTRTLTDAIVDVPRPDGVFSVTRIELTSADRTESLLLDGPVVIAVQTGSIKVWTRAGTTLDGVPVTDDVDTIYASKDQSLSVPARVRFRIRALGCTPSVLLFIAFDTPTLFSPP